MVNYIMKRFSVFVPIIAFSNIVAVIIMLPIFFIIIVSSYFIGISSLRDAIRTQKRIKLESINKMLSSLANSLIVQEDVSKTIEEKERIYREFEILDELGDKINKISESPRTISSLIKVLASGIFPALSVLGLQFPDVINYIG